MQLSKIILTLIVGGTFPLQAFVYEYRRLYRPGRGVTIDLLYDVHVPIPGITTEQLITMNHHSAAAKLYPTEQKVLSVLHSLDKRNIKCDLIWESATGDGFYTTPTQPCFIGLDWFFKLSSFKNIKFIPADRNRHCGFNSLFSVREGASEQRTGYNLTGCSFDNPAPLPVGADNAIQMASGAVAWKEYAAFRSSALKKLKDYFSTAFRFNLSLDYTKDLHTNDLFHSLCDIEMLFYMLSSKSSRIIVYGGGWHCENLFRFAQRIGFKTVHHEYNRYKEELPVQALDLLGG